MVNKLVLAGCVILDGNGRILLIHRNTPGRIQWETPGGKIEEGEDPEDTACREVEEEIGLKVKIIRQLGEREFSEDEYLMDYIWFLVSAGNDIPALLESKYDQWRYFTWDELAKMADILSPNARNLVDAYLNGELNLSIAIPAQKEHKARKTTK